MLRKTGRERRRPDTYKPPPANKATGKKSVTAKKPTGKMAAAKDARNARAKVKTLKAMPPKPGAVGNNFKVVGTIKPAKKPTKKPAKKTDTGFILFRHKYCHGEALDFGVPTNDNTFGTAAIRKAMTYGRRQNIDGLISELEMILTGPVDDKTEKRKRRLIFLQNIKAYPSLAYFYNEVQYFLNGGDIIGQETHSVCVLTSGGNIITIMANLLILLSRGDLEDIQKTLPHIINLPHIIEDVKKLFADPKDVVAIQDLARELPSDLDYKICPTNISEFDKLRIVASQMDHYGPYGPYNVSDYGAQGYYGAQGAYGAQGYNGAQSAQNPYPVQSAQGAYPVQDPYGVYPAHGAYPTQGAYPAHGAYPVQDPYAAQGALTHRGGSLGKLAMAARAEDMLGTQLAVFQTSLLNKSVIKYNIKQTLAAIQLINIEEKVAPTPKTKHLFTQIVQQSHRDKYSGDVNDLRYIDYLLDQKLFIRLNTTLNSLYMADLYAETYPLFSFINAIHDITNDANQKLNALVVGHGIDSSMFSNLDILKNSPLLPKIDQLLVDICECSSYNLFLNKRECANSKFSFWKSPELMILNDSIFSVINSNKGLRITRNIIKQVPEMQSDNINDNAIGYDSGLLLISEAIDTFELPEGQPVPPGGAIFGVSGFPAGAMPVPQRLKEPVKGFAGIESNYFRNHGGSSNVSRKKRRKKKTKKMRK